MTSEESAQRYFTDRGVLEESWRKYQIEIISTPSHEQLAGWIGSNSYSLEAAIVFPNLVPDPDTTGLKIHNYSVRCFPPTVGPDGKARKFLCTLGSTYRPYILPPVLDVAYDSSVSIYIVEKQAAALLLLQNGLSAIALEGTWGSAAKRENGERVTLHQVLREFNWTGRPVYLCFDADFKRRESVLQGLIRTYILFSTAGSVVRLLQWDLSFTGIDDYIAAKAGMDVGKQRAELDALTATVSDLTAAKASAKWIIPQYRGIFEKEIAAIRPGQAERSMLADCIHASLETTAGDLKKTWRIAAREPEPEDKPDGTLPIPEVWPKPIVHSEVLNEILAEFLDPRLVVITPSQAIVCTLYTVITYLTDYLDDWLPFLYITAGAKVSGKTKLLKLFYYLSYRADLSGNPSAASVYYALQDGVHTLCIDEIDKNETRREAILDLINFSSSRDTAFVDRVDLDRKKKVKFPTFCPKILAGNGSIRDTADSRCIKIRMMRKGPGGPRVMITKEDKRRFGVDRSKMMRLQSEIGCKLEDYDINQLQLPGDIHNREADNWLLLFIVAELVGGIWPRLLRRAFRELCPPHSADASEECEGGELGEPLVRDICRIWVETRDQEFYATGDLRMKLNSFKDRPWPEFRKGSGISDKRIGSLLATFGVQHWRQRKGKQIWGYALKDLRPIFESYASDIWNPLNDEDDDDDNDNDGDDGGESSPEDGGDSSSPPEPPETPSGDKKEEKRTYTGSQSGHVDGSVGSQSSTTACERVQIDVQIENQSSCPDISRNLDMHVTDSESTAKVGRGPDVQIKPLYKHVFSDLVPPSTPQAGFSAASTREKFVYVDTETFYPYEGDYHQPSDKTPTQLLRKRNKGEAHPWAKDPRRCALRFLTVYGLGQEPMTIDILASPIPPEVLEAIANRTLVGHNLDFDLTVLRRYGITCSNSIVDTMLASRLLGLGKEKSRVSSEVDLAPGDGMDVEEVVNPIDHDLATVVRRYLGIKTDKAKTKLGGFDWGRADLSEAHYHYMKEDVLHLPDLWKALQVELRGAHLDEVFRERMQFAVHLNVIKMVGSPVDHLRIEADRQDVVAQKGGIREELRKMYADYSHPIPKSRIKPILTVENDKVRRTPGPTHEEFSPSNRNHWIPALALHGVQVENTQAPTLRKIDAPECKLLLRYADIKSRLNAIDGITRSLFTDGRVRAAGWNQLAARTGRIISTEPNLQQVPRDWRTGFRVDPPKLWLKGDLSQIEVVIIAAVTGDQNLIGMLRAGKDVYVEVAARVFGVKAMRSEEEGFVTDKLRNVAKVIVLGTSYGLTIYGFVRQICDELGIEFGLDEADRFFQEFFGMFPGIEAYHLKAGEDSLTVENVLTARGTRRYLPALLDSEDNGYWPSREFRKRVLLNTPIQGGGADLQIRAVNKFMGRLPDGVEVVNLVHDEVDLILPSDSVLHPTTRVIRSAFQEAFAELYGTELFPQIKFSIGASWGETQPIIEDA